MKRFFLIHVLLMLSPQINAQELKEYSGGMELWNGWKQTANYTYYENEDGRVYHGQFSGIDMPGRDFSISGNYEHGYPSGLWKSHYDNYNVTSNYKKGKLDGPYHLISDNKRFEINGFFKENKFTDSLVVRKDDDLQTYYFDNEGFVHGTCKFIEHRSRIVYEIDVVFFHGVFIRADSKDNSTGKVKTITSKEEYQSIPDNYDENNKTSVVGKFIYKFVSSDRSQLPGELVNGWPVDLRIRAINSWYYYNLRQIKLDGFERIVLPFREFKKELYTSK